MPTSVLPVLIVGAGPTGLTLAIDLARRGVELRIVDALDAPVRASRAKGLQPRTLEIFEDLGVRDEILAGGGAFPRWRSYAGDRLLWEKSVYELLGRGAPRATVDRPYAETWMIPQWRTEEILRRRLAALGVEVATGTAFQSLAQDSAGVTATLRTRDGEQRLRCRYLVGTDGARSPVRQALGIPFPGETRDDERYLIADLRAEALSKEHWLNWSIDGDSVRRISMCPLPKSEHFQFVAPLSPGEPVPELSLATLQALFDQRTKRTDVELSDARWIILHRPNVRLADRFRAGRVFLAGDAAHSPPTSAGQGVNLSLQDAYNLGWKLGAVLAGAPETLLDSYEEERRPLAAAVLGVLAQELTAASVDAAAAQALQDSIRRDVFHLDHNYRGRTLSREHSAVPGAVQAGDRAPDAWMTSSSGERRRVFDLLRGPHATLLAFHLDAARAGRGLPSAGAVEVKVVAVPSPPREGDESDPHFIYAVPGNTPTLILIRPDGYVAMRTERDFDRALRAAAAPFAGYRGVAGLH